MDSEELKNLFLDTLKFRLALEKCDKNLLPASFAKFPNGCCGDVSIILAQYLKEKGYGDFNYVLGGRNGKSHAWLVKDEVVVDITADQYKDNNRKVIVMKNSDWHVDFNGKIQKVADYNNYDEDTKSQLSKAYGEIVGTISSPVMV